MARSQKEVSRCDDLENRWSYQVNSSQICSKAPQDEHRPSQNLMSDSRMVPNNINHSFAGSDIFHPDMVYSGGSSANMNRAEVQNVLHVDSQGVYGQPIPNHNIPTMSSYRNCLNDNTNSKVMRVYYDENNQPQFIVPVNHYEQYELFSTSPHQMPQYGNGDFNGNSMPTTEHYMKNAMHQGSDRSMPSTVQHNQSSSSLTQTNLFDHLLGNCMSGYWAPFGPNYGLDSQKNVSLLGDTVNQVPVRQLRNLSVENDSVNISLLNNSKPVETAKKHSEFGQNTDVIVKPRAVAEVKPMRPSYSDVLVKNPAKEKIINKSDVCKKSKNGIVDTKPTAPKFQLNKQEKTRSQIRLINNNDEKLKSESMKNNFTSQISSGSDSGDNNAGIEHSENVKKSTKKNKTKNSNVKRKWSSLDNLGESDKQGTEDSLPFNSDFIFVTAEEVNPKKGSSKKLQNEKNKMYEKQDSHNRSEDINDAFDNYHTMEFEPQLETNQDIDKIKTRKPKDTRASTGTTKSPARPGSEKKKLTQNRTKKFKRHGYFGFIQSFSSNWVSYIMKFVLWIWNLVSDILRMSAHLSFDLLSVTCTQGYDYSQALWKSIKSYVSKATSGKVFTYIDKKFGHTKFGFWRKIKWFKKHLSKEKADDEDGGEPIKNNKNIPLPATGEDAMKRLFACKGKDPYSILGVSVKCTDEEIKRYYRKQAFLVHPDKNQTPGAEEAFKILQHAFDLIGEPERRSAYDRRVLESHHVEAAWSELNDLLAQLHEKMEFAANTIRCTNCGRRHKRVLTDRPCYAARSCSQCKIRHSAKEGDIWAETSLWGLVLVFYACMDGAVYQITQWASCQKKNLKHLRPDCHVVQYRIVLGNKAGAGVGSGSTGTSLNGNGSNPAGTGSGSSNAPGTNNAKRQSNSQDSLDDFLNNLYSKSGQSSSCNNAKASAASEQHDSSKFKRRNKKGKV